MQKFHGFACRIFGGRSDAHRLRSSPHNQVLLRSPLGPWIGRVQTSCHHFSTDSTSSSPPPTTFAEEALNSFTNNPNRTNKETQDPFVTFLQTTTLSADEILAEFEAKKRAGFHPDSATYAQLINRMAKESRFDKAFAIWEEYSHAFKPSPFMINSYMNICLKAARPDKVFQAYQDMKQSGLRPNERTFAVLLKTCIHTRTPEKGLQYYDEMSSYGLHSDMHTYALAAHLSFHAGNTNRSVKIFELMQQESPNPDVESLKYMVPVLAQLKKTNEMADWLGKLRDQNGCLTRIGYLKVMTEFNRAGRVDAVIDVFEDAVRHQRSTSDAYQLLLQSLAGSNQLEIAIDYHNKMSQLKILPSYRTAAMLMQLALKNGKYDFVLQLFREAKLYHEQQFHQSEKLREGYQDRIYPLAAMALAKMEKHDEMMALLKENVPRKWSIFLELLAEVMLVLTHQGKYDYVDQVFQLIDAMGYRPTRSIWVTTITAHLQGGNLEKAMQCEADLRRSGMILPANIDAALNALRQQARKSEPAPAST